MSWNPRRNSSFAQQMNQHILSIEREREASQIKKIKNCLIVDVISGEENNENATKTKHLRHVWWKLETPQGNMYTVQCGHDYDTIQSQIGNVEAQKGRYATIFYRGYSRNDKENGYAQIQADREAQMPNPTGESIPFSIGALGGIFDEDALFKSMNVGYQSESIGPKV